MTLRATDSRGTAPVLLASLAGPCLLLAGVLIVVSQLVVWPLRRGSIVTAATSPVYVAAMTGFLVAIWVLIIGVFAVHRRHAARAGTFGLVARVAAAMGLANIAGNLWFDTFVVPWLARQIHGADRILPPPALFDRLWCRRTGGGHLAHPAPTPAEWWPRPRVAQANTWTRSAVRSHGPLAMINNSMPSGGSGDALPAALVTRMKHP